MPPGKIEAIATYLSFFIAYLVDRNSKLCSWNAHRADAGTTFDQLTGVPPRLFVERSPRGLMEAWLASAGPSIETAASVPSAVTVYQGDASSLPFDANFFDAIVTDPPYYDAIRYADLGAFFWVWERMIPHDSPTIGRDAMVTGEYIETRGDDPNIYRERMLRAFEEVYRVLKPGRRFCLIFSGKVTGSFQEYVRLCQQAGLELLDVKRVPEEIGAVAKDAKQITYLIYLRKPNSRPVREALQAAEASSLLDAVAAGKPVLYSGLAELIAKQLEEIDVAQILPPGGKGAIIEQIMEVLAVEDPRELIEKCFSRRELREIAKRLNAGTALDAAINPIEFVLSQYGFWLPSASKKIDGATQVRQKLRVMQGRISQANMEKAHIRGAFVEGCTAVERLLRVSVWGWAQLVFGSDRDSQLLRVLQEEDAGKRWDLNRLSAGHVITLFRRLPDAIAASPMAPKIERKFGRRHVYLPLDKKTKFADRLDQVFSYRNRVEHDKDGYWTTITLADAREELAPVLARAGQLLLELVEARAIPRVVEPIRETRDKWNRKSYLLSTDDGIDLEGQFSSPLTLGASYLYFGSETNPRPVDPFVLPIEELGTVP